MDVGSELRAARELRDLSLQDLAARTKIRATVLRAMEDDDIERLPGGVFTRGFVKAYATEVGLDPTETAARYMSQFEPPPAVSVESERTAPHAAAPAEDDYAKQPLARVTEYSGAISAIAAILLVAGCFFVLSRLQGTGSPEDGELAAAAAAAVAPPAAAAPTMSRAEVGTTGAVERSVRVEIQPSTACWISANADGTRTLSRLMQPGERETIDVREALILRAGDAAGCNYSINGTPGRPLGRAGQPITVTITPDNYRQFLPQ